MYTWLWSQDTWRWIFIAVVSGLITSSIIWAVKRLPSVVLAILQALRSFEMPRITFRPPAVLGLMAGALSIVQLFMFAEKFGMAQTYQVLFDYYQQFSNLLLRAPVESLVHVKLAPWAVDSIVIYLLIGASLSRHLIIRGRQIAAALYLFCWPLYVFLDWKNADYAKTLSHWLLSILAAVFAAMLFIAINVGLKLIGI
jgi:hypothetical protein